MIHFALPHSHDRPQQGETGCTQQPAPQLHCLCASTDRGHQSPRGCASAHPPLTSLDLPRPRARPPTLCDCPAPARPLAAPPLIASVTAPPLPQRGLHGVHSAAASTAFTARRSRRGPPRRGVHTAVPQEETAAGLACTTAGLACAFAERARASAPWFRVTAAAPAWGASPYVGEKLGLGA